MPRKVGSKNKSKFIIVSVDEIIKKFNPAASIRVSSDYAPLFDIEEEEELNETVEKPKEQDDDGIEMVIHEA